MKTEDFQEGAKSMRVIRNLSIVVVVVVLSAMAANPRPSGGSVSGKVTYTGTPAKAKVIDMSKEPSCAKQHATPVTTETVVTGPGDSLENVVVYISAGTPDESAPGQSVKLEQKGCQYVPHLLAFQVNQPLEIVNDDQTSHNIHPLPRLNREWNRSQPPGTPPISEKYDKAEFILVKCNVHPWMRGYFAVMKNSHFGVTDSDGGFKLPNLPPGKYTISAWHESYGEQSQDVTVSGSENQTINFAFKAKDY
jgi:Carboxypeptidase regulatory-like domain